MGVPGDGVHGINIGQDGWQAIVNGSQVCLLVHGLPACLQGTQILQVVPRLIHCIRQLHKP